MILRAIVFWMIAAVFAYLIWLGITYYNHRTYDE